MTLTRSRKIVLGILAAAVAALLVDRLVLAPSAGGPKRAKASDPEGGPVEDLAEVPSLEADTAPAEGPPSLADRLQSVAGRYNLDPGRMRDGFTPSEAWLAELQPPAPQPETEPQKAEPKPSPAARFAEQHRLTSVILTSGGGSAVVDGKVVPVGRTVDGFTLVRLSPDTAVFEAGGEEVTLRLRR